MTEPPFRKTFYSEVVIATLVTSVKALLQDLTAGKRKGREKAINKAKSYIRN